ncbi:MAG: hypothetical protein J6T24_09805 [Clostridia bacterium]|nr:hypothetical protein [Clostridia bacterium]
MESVADGMESRPKTEKYKLSLDAIRGRAAMPYNAFGVDSIPSPSALDKTKTTDTARPFPFSFKNVTDFGKIVLGDCFWSWVLL